MIMARIMPMILTIPSKSEDQIPDIFDDTLYMHAQVKHKLKETSMKVTYLIVSARGIGQRHVSLSKGSPSQRNIHSKSLLLSKIPV